MTEYKKEVAEQRVILEEEAKENKIVFIEAVYGSMTVGYASGKRVTTYSDKRKKTKIEYYEKNWGVYYG